LVQRAVLSLYKAAGRPTVTRASCPGRVRRQASHNRTKIARTRRGARKSSFTKTWRRKTTLNSIICILQNNNKKRIIVILPPANKNIISKPEAHGHHNPPPTQMIPQNSCNFVLIRQ